MKKIAFTLLVAVGVLAWMGAKYIVSQTNYIDSDFFSFWLAGRMVWLHQYPYAGLDWINGHILAEATWISDPAFLYPLPLAFVFAPLGLLSLYSAFGVWVWLSLIMLFISFLLLLPLFGHDQKHYIVPVLAGWILFRPLITLFVQLTALLLVVVAAGARLWERSRWFAGGVVLSLTALKPNIGIPFILLITAYLLVNKKIRAIAGMAAGGMTLLLAGMMYKPVWVLDYLHVLQNKNAQVFGYSPTVWGLSAFTCKFNLPCTMYLGGGFSLILIVVFFFLLVKGKLSSPSLAIGAAIALALALTPYLWPCDQILLVLPIVLTMAIIKKRSAPYLVGALYFMAIGVLSYVLLGFSVPLRIENLNGILSLVVFGMLVVLLWGQRAQDTRHTLLEGSAERALR